MEGEEATAPSFHSTKSRPKSSTLWGIVLSKSRVRATGYHCFHQSNVSASSTGGEEGEGEAVAGRVIEVERVHGRFMEGEGGTKA